MGDFVPETIPLGRELLMRIGERGHRLTVEAEAVAAQLRTRELTEGDRIMLSRLEGVRAEWRETALELSAEVSRVVAEVTARDLGYRERAQLVAYLAAVYPSCLAPAADVAEDGWVIVYIETPEGQLSWHIAPDDVPLFGHVLIEPGKEWDGHSTEVKYRRLAALTEAASAGLLDAPGDGGQWMRIAFMGHVELTGYVTEITIGGQPGFHIDLPDKLWGDNPLAWREYAATALYSREPVNDRALRMAWESRRRSQQAWAARRALEAATQDSDYDRARDLAREDGDYDSCEPTL